jgi:PAS domain S-box-containing protein
MPSEVNVTPPQDFPRTTARILRLLLVASLVLPILLFALYAWRNHGEVRHAADATVMRTTAIMQEHALRVFETHELIIDQIEARIDGESWAEIDRDPTLSAYLAHIAHGKQQIASLWLTGPDGYVRAGSVPWKPGLNGLDRDFFLVQRARDAGTYISKAYVGRSTSMPSFAVSRRRPSPTGAFDGIVHVAVSSNYFRKFFARVAPSPEHAAILFRADGQVLARDPPMKHQGPLPPGGGLLRATASADRGLLVERSDEDGTERLVAFRRVAPYPLYVAYGMDMDVAMRPWWDGLLFYAAVGAPASLAVAFISLFALRRVNAERLAVTRWRRSEANFRHLYNKTPMPLHSLDAEDRFIDVSDYWLEMMGYTREEVIGRKIDEFMTPDTVRLREEVVMPQFLEVNEVKDVEYRLVRKSGEPIDVLLSSRLDRDRDGRFVRTFTALTDISARKRAEAALRRSEQQFRDLYNKTPVMLHSIDAEGKILEVSDYWLEQMQYQREEVIGRHVSIFLTEDSARHADEIGRPALLRDGFLRDAAYRYLRKDGSVMDVLLNAIAQTDAGGRFRRSLSVSFDVTDRLRAEAALRQTQKMEAVGQLTGGIAHDFNNLLTAVLGNLELLAPQVASGAGRRLLEAATRAAARGEKLTQQLLAFSRKQHVEPRLCDLNQLVAGMSDLLARTLGGTARIETVLGEALWPALVDPNQLELVLLNLAINARDAMPAGGTLTIATSNCALLARERIDDLPGGQYVRIAVSDTGAGMAPDVRDRAFEPFFTTKEVGKGTGLGLSQVYGVMKQFGGGARIRSEIGRGTCVELYLPRVQAGERVVTVSAAATGSLRPLTADEQSEEQGNLQQAGGAGGR